MTATLQSVRRRPLDFAPGFGGSSQPLFRVQPRFQRWRSEFVQSEFRAERMSSAKPPTVASLGLEAPVSAWRLQFQ
eukprot:367286-Alexandrium_andersonii.AAC.1